ncbi:MAG: DUF5056 domain-containing protein [Bacteroides sp.]
MTEIDDKLIAQLMKQSRQMLPDNGFSRRVIRNLPDREERQSNLLMLICALSAIILFLVFDGVQILFSLGKELIKTIIQNDIMTISPITLYIVAVVLIVIGMQRLCSIE